MKYCIACKHLYYTPPEPGIAWSEITWQSGTDASMACRKGHWARQFDDYSDIESFRVAMEMAQNCPDFDERNIDEN